VAVSYSCRLNGIERIVLTKPDILDVFEEIPVCVGYLYKGERLQSFPTEPWILEKVVPQYRAVKGWKTPIHRMTQLDSLPPAFLDYVKVLEEAVEAKVAVISTGVGRKDSLLIAEELDGIVDLKKVRAGL
jgi:adenylosuccinate synthase